MAATIISTRIQESINLAYRNLDFSMPQIPTPALVNVPALLDWQNTGPPDLFGGGGGNAGAAGIGAMNAGYLELTRTAERVETIIESNTDGQRRFNDEVDDAGEKAETLGSKLKSAIGSVFNMENLGKVLDLSDSVTDATNQLNSINDGAQTTQELMSLVYESAKSTHAPFLDTANAIAEMGNAAGSAFGGNDEMIAFMNQAGKQFALAGASAEEQSASVLSLGEAMADGVVDGQELNSVLGAAPEIAKMIEQSMGWAEGSLDSYAQKGMVTSQAVKNALFSMADETNAKFADMPITFSQAMEDFKSSAVMAFTPVLAKINEIVNSPQFEAFAQGASVVFSMLADTVMNLFSLIGTVGGFIAENWSIIAPILFAAAAAMIAFLIAANGAAIAAAVAGAATAAWAAVQNFFNVIMSMNPIGLIILAVVALIAIIASVCAWIAKTTDIAGSAFGVMCGGINVVIQWFKNLAFTVANLALGIKAAIGALAENIVAAFHNSISNVKAGFYGLLSVALNVVAGICEALNKLPFIEFDYSGITDAADSYEAKMRAAQEDQSEYKDIGAAFEEGNSTYDTFTDGWAQDAFQAGAEWGDGKSDQLSGFLGDLFGGKENPFDQDDMYSKFANQTGAGGTSGYAEESAGNLDSIAGDTGAISDSVGVSAEDLKYLRDIAEQEAINRFTTAEIKVQMNNSNHIRQGADLDGIIDGLTQKVVQSMETLKEGA